MRTILGCTLLVVLAVSGSGTGADEKIDGKKLVGKWQPKEQKADDTTKIVLEFTKDGKLDLSLDFNGMRSKLNYSYKLDGNKLTTVGEKDGKEDKDTSTITKLTDTELVIKKMGKEEALELVRIKAKK